MTKVAIKGPATGTGSYTLNAPDTDSTLALELPITGTHLASAQADGMPLGLDGDPVVESGSNSDGEWTRWADGTQECRGERQMTGPLEITGGVYRKTLAGQLFPVAFSSNPYFSGIPIHSITGGNGVITWLTYPNSSSRVITPTNFQLCIARGNDDGEIDVIVGWIASGRWK